MSRRFNFQAVKLAGPDGQNLTMAHLYATRLLQAAIRGFIERKRRKEAEEARGSRAWRRAPWPASPRAGALRGPVHCVCHLSMLNGLDSTQIHN